ncbi:MAG: CoA-transferase [SAR86 cluster bacterium]|nr:CoA-transferase [SAR86 cluster bacterium]
MTKIIGSKDIISHIRSGMTIGIGGWGSRRKPMSLVRELLKSDVEDLTIVSYGGPDVGMLCSAKKVKKLIFGFVSMETTPLESHFRKARQEGSIEVMELDEGLLQFGLIAAGMRLPFFTTRVGLGSDILSLNPEIKTISSPYKDNETLVAMPAIELDVALIHVHESDDLGNTFIYGPDLFIDDKFVRASSKTFISTERIIKTDEIDKNKSMFNWFERSLVTGVIESPYGAHPTAATPNYGFDKEHLSNYSKATDQIEWEAYFENYISLDHESYLKAVGGKDHITSLEVPVF